MFNSRLRSPYNNLIIHYTNSLLKSSIEKVQLSATEQNKAFV
ncbi:Uncharacterized protein dnm_082900 [Desulfonema magnum]|uniref:Uncharacterized protein n=1 Tax=Desulfonema magnum TaxID=45655 RepID=A0A975BVY2_9BACT|nr:Uncharacterized protein dnm_082900 [Desulfonema magnum]